MKTLDAIASITVIKTHQTLAKNLIFLFMQIPLYQLTFNLAKKMEETTRTFLDRLLLRL